MNYVFALDSVFKSVPPKTQNLLDQPVCFTHANVLLSYVNENILLGNLPFKIMSVILWPTLCHCYLKMHAVGEGPSAIL